ncbi:KpsF/GutQ family sugar-phosphate isomerase [Clostridiaceae bacterium]|nr:KpsF/GutQ family sugar-phosphate isomerase [Clostridiaceae bacterium]
MDKLAEGKKVLDIEIDALKKTRDALDDTFIKILDMITGCRGKLIMIGMGKPGHIASKLAATFASLGTPSFCMHPAEAMHGDLGVISSQDIVMVISYSGESEEIVKILPVIKLIGAVLIGITGNGTSTLAKMSDVVQVFPKFHEACYLGLAPTSSTTVELAYGDALAVVASGIYGFKNTDFGRIHPAGTLGKKLITRVDDIMMKGEKNAVVHLGATLKDSIIELSKKGLGIVSVVDEQNELKGVITNGDLRRQLEKGSNIYEMEVNEIMTHTPVTIQSGKLAVEALKLLKEKNIFYMPVVYQKKPVGMIRVLDIVNAGIV